MKTYKDGSGQGFIFQGNDGGITKGLESDPLSVSWSDISRNGLNITQYYGIGIPGNNTDLIIGGTQDGNFCRYSNNFWSLPYTGDAGDVIVDRANQNNAYMVTFMTDFYVQKSTDGGQTWPDHIYILDQRRNDAPIEMSKKDVKRIYLGGINVWRTLNGTDFSQISNLQNDSEVLKTIREAPSDENTIYAAKQNPTWNKPEFSKKLFKTNNGGTEWIDITPTSQEFSLHDVGIFDIAVHPTNPNLIYVALDRNVPGKRVFRYNDGVWTNISEGLPDVPVNSIKYYQRGVNLLNELFSGTDLGVYYRNDVINRWIPFGTGLPLVSVSDIEINNSTKEIVASTFGRGIYKANLCFDPQEVNPTYVESTQTWGDKVLTNDVIINQGVVLTITGMVEMPPSKYIHVQKGGLLILDGGTITNACKDEQWGGVIVYGSSTQPQTLNYQGMIEIKNNGKIENALVGIHCKNAKDEDGGSLGTSVYSGGGIILANNAGFYNNSIAVVFEKYTLSSASRFRLCNFVINDELFADANFNCFVRMNEVNGITFTGCTFKNERTSFAFDRGKGIYSNNSFFIVDQYTIPPLPAQKTSFNGLKYGIYAIGLKGGRTFSVQNTDFNYNESGIYVSGVDVINIKYSHFFMKFNNPLVPEIKSGIYLDKCTGYTIEENDFHTTSSGPGLSDYGIYINSSGEADNLIYKNKFYDNTYGITAQDKNRNKDGSNGLLLKCNEFNNVKTDIAVLKSDPNAPLMGIAESQGSDVNEESPAGNLFSNLPQSTGYYSILNNCYHINYYHHSTSTTTRVRPGIVTEETVTRVPTGFDFIASTCCPSHTSGGGGTGSIDGVTLSYKSEAESTTQTLNALIDDGDTGDKVMDVNSAAPSEALIIRSDLLLTSPYVSDTVIQTAINREELLNNAMLRDIMVANPQSAKSKQLMQELDYRLEPMPEYMKDEIMEGVFTLSAKELLESRRDMNEQFYNYGFNRILSASLTDTVPVAVDTLLYLLSADGSASSLMKQAWILLESGDTTNALNRMSSIGNEIELTDSELSELNQQQGFMQWLAINPVIDSTSLETLNNFMNSNSLTVSSSTRAIMVSNNLLTYNEPYLEPDLTKSFEVKKPGVRSTEPKDTFVKVYPNPANKFITIEYNYGNTKLIGSINITDPTGKLVYSEEPDRAFDQIILDTHNFSPGNYVIQLVINKKTVCTAKFVISR